MRLTKKIAVLMALAMAACGGSESESTAGAANSPKGGPRAHLQSLLQGADSNKVVSLVTGDTLYLSPATAEFYRKRRFKPVWSEDDKLNEQGQKLYKVLAETEQDGLNPLRYRYDVVTKMSKEFEKEGEGELSEGLEARYGAELDY
jgi:murein L,D-transpeptidase YcbB/YkuD